MENNERIFDALRKIEKIIDNVKNLFPTIEKSQAKIAVKNYDNPFQILKRINGIITNYNKSNAKIKLESLLKFLGIIPYEKKRD